MYFWKILLILWTVSTAKTQDEGFKNFLVQAMEDFPEWLISTGRDPTPMISTRVWFSSNTAFFNISGYSLDHVFSRHSDFWISPDEGITTNLLEGRFSITVEWNHLISDAYCYVEGTIMSTIPVTGDGHCRIEDHGSDKEEKIEVKSWSMFRVHYLGVTPDGYLDMTDADIFWSVSAFAIRDSTVSFESLNAGGYEPNVIEVMLRAYAIRLYEIFPMEEYMKLYLGGLFETTPLSQIIGTTARPSTTTTKYDTSSAPSSTTMNPCIADGIKTVIHNETVLERNYEYGADGKVLLATKKLLLVTEYEAINQ